MEAELLTKPLPIRKRVDERLTFDQFCDMVDEDQKAHLINGVFYMESPASTLHENLFGFLHFILMGYVSRRKLGIMLGSRTAVRLSEYLGPEPDLIFVSDARRHIVQEQFIDGAPDMIAEIVSPGSRRLDRVEKKELYAEFGVREYWLIDPFQQTAEFFYNQNGRWQEKPVDEKNVFYSNVIPGFWFRLDWLFAEELPDGLDVLDLILHGPEK